MRRILACTGVLGGGTAHVFALAAATAILFPQGTLVSSGWNGSVMFTKAMPALGGGGVFVDDIIEMPLVEAPQAVPGVAP